MRACARVQRVIADELVEECENLDSVSSILDLGCGVGFLLERLIEIFPAASIVGLDISVEMLERAWNAVEQRKRVEFCCADITKYSPNKSFDLIVSSSALQWVEVGVELFEKIRSWLQPEGTFAVSLMTDGTLKELRSARLQVAPDKSPLKSMPTEVEVLSALESAGFAIDRHMTKNHVEEYKSFAELMDNLKKIGVTSGDLSRSHSRLTRQELVRLAEIFELELLKNGKITQSYASTSVICHC